ncbi:hypothetical protein [Tessaracoccus defluvii]|uniref:hypothetical protein n=1 Tax=Tessaracoccus defluvii TaxID=1285901 RepID=UPI001D03EE9F|nr:hypothetical protein [Tessaracoccus defluvii]
MSTATVTASRPPTTTKAAQSPADPKRILIGALAMILVGWFIGNGFLALAYYPQWFSVGLPVLDKVIQALLAMVLGIGGAVLFFFCMNVFVEGLPGRLGQFLMPYAWILPATSPSDCSCSTRRSRRSTTRSPTPTPPPT